MSNFTKNSSNKWEIVPEVDKKITLNTTNKYLDTDIIIDPMSGGTAAVYSTYVKVGSDTSKVPLVTKAGYAGVNYISALTVPAAKVFGSATEKGAFTLEEGTSSTNLTTAYMTMYNNSVLYLTDAITGKTWTIKCDSVNNALTIEQ